MKIDQIDKDIIDNLIKGLTAKQISSKVFLTTWAVRSRINRMRKETNSKNTTELTHNFKELLNLVSLAINNES